MLGWFIFPIKACHCSYAVRVRCAEAWVPRDEALLLQPAAGVAGAGLCILLSTCRHLAHSRQLCAHHVSGAVSLVFATPCGVDASVCAVAMAVS